MPSGKPADLGNCRIRKENTGHIIDYKNISRTVWLLDILIKKS